MQLSAQETNVTIMAIELEELTANYTRVREHLRINNNYKAQFDVLHNQHEETLRKLNRFNLKETHWIGLNDLDTEGHWVWVNNQPLNNSLVFWMKRKDEISEPDNWTKVHLDGEDCTSLGHPNGDTDFWTDAYCFEEKRFVCEAVAAV
ncbi:hypothetical protein QQF64_013207 [Cirrhinus molitorella]|uniref:C-type lectin domain-containing protein n=1 Tax=Cirrhinus molitorella TaxID=172907 RepID=A0ABR3LT22_9TELE